MDKSTYEVILRCAPVSIWPSKPNRTKAYMDRTAFWGVDWYHIALSSALAAVREAKRRHWSMYPDDQITSYKVKEIF